MYRYDEYDRALVDERVAEFRDQVGRRLSGDLSEEEFLPLRLQNGLYLQRHAYMLRVAIPYGTLSSNQLRTLASIARDYDRGYGHFTTRQNIQFNWITLEQVPDILQRLAGADMHAIQTSGNCVRNITTEAFAGVAADEIMDPRPLAEILRQWSTVNPEFLFLPRKFKIALCAAAEDRAAVMTHDLGLYLYRGENSDMLFDVTVGGGLGRTPILAQPLKQALPWHHLLSYVEAVLRVYNRHGRRDNKYKARIKILVKALGIEAFANEVEAEWQHLKDGPAQLTDAEYARVAASFQPPAYAARSASDSHFTNAVDREPEFARWVRRNTHPHKVPGYVSVILSTKPGNSTAPDTGQAPGDVTATQMEQIAQLADRYGFGEIRVAHEQNLVLPDVAQADLYSLWKMLRKTGLETPNIHLLTDIIACPGGDYCSLANAKSIPVALAIQQQFEDQQQLQALGKISVNVSGCMNACGHHHIGNIGILGVDKNGSEWYQVTLGGTQGKRSRLGKVMGPAFSAEEIPQVIATLANVYREQRIESETFVDTVERIGLEPFKARVYPREAASP
ncbi:MAG: nitrite/sulfite reductase [Pseudomonadota bacterium]|nr:nitrite/sulfite reductase [Pseudomonadota bacterium]